MVQHYINGRFDNYGFNGASYDNQWSNLYAGSLQDLEIIINQGEANGELHFVGISKIQKAYAYSILVDLFGDIPFSLAGSDNPNPGVDLGEDIYPQLISLIDEGLQDLDEQSTIALGASDLIYGGNLDNWRRMANTLKLKMYNQTRLVDPDASASQISALLTADNLINSSSQDFTWQFTSSNAPEGRHPNFQADWAAGGLENNLSSFMIGLMNASSDPRIPYYFYKQSGCSLSGINGGDTGNPGDDEVRAIHGVYPVGGLYDDNSCQVHNETLGLQGAGIFPMITYTNRLFIQAEAALELGTPGDPRQLLADAVNSSMVEIQALAGVNIPDDEDQDYVNAVLAAYDAASDDEARLGIIMTEKYVAMFGNGIESYNDFRRTGYPINLNTPIVANGPFPNIFPIPPIEVNANASIDPLTDLSQTVFWDIN